MQRLRTRTTTALAAAWLLTGCGSTSGGPTAVTLADLVEEQDRFDGEDVIAEGIVRVHDDPLHYWIEDPEVNRVEIVPPEVVEDHVGDRVRVEGRFTFRDDEGRRIAVDELEVLAEASQASAAG